MTAPGWPSLDRLGRFTDFLARLAALPGRVGPIDLSRLRDTSLPVPETWPAVPTTPSAPDRPPAGVDAGWLAAAVRQAGPLPGSLLGVVRRLRRLPDWTLSCVWLLECALAWEGPRPADRAAAVRGELGDLYCQTGDIIGGVRLLDEGREMLGPGEEETWDFALRAARWIAVPNRAAATGRLLALQQAEGAPPAVRLHAELELLGHDRPAGADPHDLVERVRRADALAERAAPLGAGGAAVRARARHLTGLWLGASRIRPLRAAGQDRLLEALHECTQADDFGGASHLLDALGRSHLRLGSFRHASNLFEESIALKQKMRDLWGLGGALTGLAECLLAAGQARASAPYFRVNLLLMEALGGMQVLFARNLARHLNALVAAGCDPLDAGPPAPDLLALAHELLEHYSAFVPNPAEDPYCLLLGGGRLRLAARDAASAADRRAHLEEGVRQAGRARDAFRRQGHWVRVAEADRTLAALLLDRAAGEGLGSVSPVPSPASLSPVQGTGSGDDLARARQALEEAEGRHQGEAGRVQAELLWARYHQLAGAPYQMQLHLAAARRAAEASGAQALALGVDARLGVQLTGPTGPAPAQLPSSGGAPGPDEVVVLASPGETVPFEVRATDWRDRPLPAYALLGLVEAEEGSAPRVSPARVVTDHAGRARFEITALGPARAVFRAAAPDGVHALALRVVVVPVELEWAADLAGAGADDAHASRLLRQLFGPGCARLRIAREFTGGRSGTRVLLAEPFFRAEGEAEVRGQPCIVKLGPRGLLEDERRRYLRFVKDLLPVNVSRLDGFTTWHDAAALRMSLVGDARPGQVREAREWLAGAAAFDAHLLLERVFVGDLGPCWYANSPRQRDPAPVGELFGPMLPCLLHLADAAAPSQQPVAGPASLGEGLRPPAGRAFRAGEVVTVHAGALLGCKPAPGGWEYEFRAEGPPLRFTFRTPLSPELVEADAGAGKGPRLVRGVVESTAHDRLAAALGRCLAAFNETHPGERVGLSPDGRWLLAEAEGLSRRLPNPLDHLGGLLAAELPCNWSLTHGDLHGRNVLVGPQGQPFYIDFARTGAGPTVFDFIKFETYLWHENFAGWPHGGPPPGCDLAGAVRLLEEFSAADPARHFPSPYARPANDAARGAWPGLFRQCLATLRSAARPHVVDGGGRDYFVPLALYAALMLRWCDPDGAADPAARRTRARQGVVHALASASLLAGVLAGDGR